MRKTNTYIRRQFFSVVFKIKATVLYPSPSQGLLHKSAFVEDRYMQASKKGTAVVFSSTIQKRVIGSDDNILNSLGARAEIESPC